MRVEREVLRLCERGVATIQRALRCEVRFAFHRTMLIIEAGLGKVEIIFDAQLRSNERLPNRIGFIDSFKLEDRALNHVGRDVVVAHGCDFVVVRPALQCGRGLPRILLP